jgi:hypothetical protein
VSADRDRLAAIRARYAIPHGVEAIANGHADASWLLAERDAAVSEAAGLRTRLAAVEYMAERADRKGYQLDPADILDTLKDTDRA